VAALLGACAREAPPRWTALAASFDPSAVASDRPGGGSGELVPGVRLVDAGGGALRLEADLARADWTRPAGPGLWQARMPELRPASPPDRAPEERLDAGDRAFRATAPPRRGGEPPPPGSFWRNGATSLILRLDPAAAPPERATLALSTARGWRGPEGDWQLVGRRFAGPGLALLAGERWTVRADVPPDARLRFAVTAEPLVAGQEARASFEVRVGGTRAWSGALEAGADGAYAWHEVALPPEGGAMTLEFRVDGDLARTAFAAPTIGPATVGRPGERPFASRPDLIVFLADTFRADNLRFYGGERALAPEVERFLRESVAFRRAWSVGTFTLPAHVSMFSGYFPRQCSTAGMSASLPLEVDTLAERLARHGYRTGAVTDSVVVSQTYNLQQGFEWFDELHGTLDATLQRVRDFLDADDGRPVFLWVHTYRVHRPYHASASTLARLGAELGLDGSEVHQSLHQELERLGGGAVDGIEGPEAAAVVSRLERLYRAGVADLDRGFGELRAELEARGLLERGHLVFTSDHGEAFYEHGELYHSGRVYEEQIRVPLAIGGGGLAVRAVEEAVSLVDLAPTLAQLAGTPPDPGWPGRSVLGLERDRPVFAFECAADPADSSLALIEGAHKAIAFETPASLAAGPLLGAFDLAADPGERRDAREAAWVEELLDRLGPAAATLLLPAVSASPAAIDPARLESLRDLGYFGDTRAAEFDPSAAPWRRCRCSECRREHASSRRLARNPHPGRLRLRTTGSPH